MVHVPSFLHASVFCSAFLSPPQAFLGVFGRVCCVRREDFLPNASSFAPFGEADGQDGQDEGQKGRQQAVAAEWRQLSTILDRVFFVVFLAVVLFTAIAN